MFGQKSTLEQAREEHHPIIMEIDSLVLGNQYKPEITSLMEAELHYRRHDVVKREGISEYINEDDVMHLCGYTNITNPSKWRKEIIARHNFVSGVDFMTKDDHSHQKRGQKPKILEFSLRAANRILLAAMTSEKDGITPILTSDQKLTMRSSQFAEILGYEKKFINQKIRELFPEEITSKKILLVASRYGGVDEYHLPEVESNMLVAKGMFNTSGRFQNTLFKATENH
ncbi:hypothetical protein [Vibrio alfacsensis]|uniref:hypothetical protein n=1 Tax=Vibrio alfacsensis TaxID=1074311 RepID=UPI004067D5BA